MLIDELDEVEWHEVVDVICVGPGRAALAAAVGSAAAGLDVLLVAGRGALGDSATAFLDAMTTDFPMGEPPSAATPLRVRYASEPVSPDLPKYVSFSGPALFDWGAACLNSPYGLLCSTATAADGGVLRVGAVDPVAAADLDGWLAERAAELAIRPEDRSELRDLVCTGGGVSGAVIGGPDGESLVCAGGGVVIATGTGAALLPQPLDQPAELIVRSHPHSRFAQLELLIDHDVLRS